MFREDAHRRRYLARLVFYAEKFSFRVVAYCLMDNHVHLAIERGKVPLSRIMAGLQSCYTQYFNRRHDRSGHLFQGRYKAFLVEKDRYALEFCERLLDSAKTPLEGPVPVREPSSRCGRAISDILLQGHKSRGLTPALVIGQPQGGTL